MSRRSRLLAALLAALAAGPALAQDTDLEEMARTGGSFEADGWRPSLDGGPWNTLEGPGRVAGYQTRADLVYAKDTVRVAYADGSGEPLRLIGDLMSLHLSAARGFGRVRAGLTVPLHLLAQSDIIARAPWALVGDPRLSAKVSLLEPGEGGGPGLAARGDLSVPLGASEVLLGQPGALGELGLVGAWTAEDAALGLALGSRFLPQTELENSGTVDDQLTYALGAAMSLGSGGLQLTGEIYGRTPFNAFFSAQGTAMEGLYGLTGPLQRGGSWRAAVGHGFPLGIGTAQVRVLVGVGKAPPQELLDGGSGGDPATP